MHSLTFVFPTLYDGGGSWLKSTPLSGLPTHGFFGSTRGCLTCSYLAAGSKRWFEGLCRLQLDHWVPPVSSTDYSNTEGHALLGLPNVYELHET
jgi:hypothetical protein